MYTAQDWKNCFIVIWIKDNPNLPRVKSIDIKPKITDFDRKIGHKSVMSIREFLVDRYEPVHLVDQVIRDMEVIGYASSEGANTMDQLFSETFPVNWAASLWVSVYMWFIHG